MAGVVPLPTTRVSNLLIRQRLQSQLQADQLEIFRLQNQISTGRRITLPSEDAPAAQRAITLQRLIERKTQLRSNVSTGLEFLTNTDAVLKSVASTLGSIRGEALGVAGTTATEEEREVVVGNINAAIDALLRVANHRYRGRYLFAGSQTNVQPYAWSGNSIKYSGDEKFIQNFSDLDVLFSTNAPGANVFGGISEEVVSGVDLNPHLSYGTLLSSLRGGRGMSSNGAIRISDGTNSSTIDLSRAVTVGDIVRLIEENPPAGRRVTASVTGTGLTLQLDVSGGGNLTVTEVGSGRTASELGVLNTTGVGTSPLVSGDLDPAILKTTQLDDLLGTKARARLASAGDNNDVLIEAAANGAARNGVTIQFVNDVAAGSEFASLSGSTLSVHIAAGESTANAVVNAINAQGTFTARLDPTDSASPSAAGSGQVAGAATAVTAGGGGTTFDRSGLRITNGGQSHTVGFAQAKTVEDLLNALNGSDAGLYAAINSEGRGIDVRSRLNGNDFQIGENSGATAAQLGLRTLTREVALDDLNYGVGVPTSDDVDITIGSSQISFTTRSGAVINVNLTGAATVTDVINAINLASGTSITAQSADAGAGIRLIDNTFGAGSLGISQSGAALAIPGGIGSHIEAPDLTVGTRSGQHYNINLSGAETIGDVIDKINAITGANVTARLATFGNGIELVDNTVGVGQLSVFKDPASQAAEYLGLVPNGSTQASTTSGVLVGSDQHFHESNSVFSTLIRLRDAIASGDITGMNRAIARIDDDINRATFAQAEVGARERALTLAQQNLEDEDVQLQSALSNEIEVDLVEAISNLTARQVALQASLHAMGNILQLSLLDFI